MICLDLTDARCLSLSAVEVTSDAQFPLRSSLKPGSGCCGCQFPPGPITQSKEVDSYSGQGARAGPAAVETMISFHTMEMMIADGDRALSSPSK